MISIPARIASALLAGVVLPACGTAAPAADTSPATPAPAESPAPETVTEPSTLDGIYTVAQADRGLEVFQNICSECHETEEWQDDGFLARWEGESVYRFWYYIYERMPNGAPPYSLPREQVSDVLTYILQLNGLPAGDIELGNDDDAIDDHWLHWGANTAPVEANTWAEANTSAKANASPAGATTSPAWAGTAPAPPGR